MIQNVKRDFEQKISEIVENKAQEIKEDSDDEEDDCDKNPELKESIKASTNKRNYLKKHALSIKIPTCSILSSKIYRKDPKYFI